MLYILFNFWYVYLVLKRFLYCSVLLVYFILFVFPTTLLLEI